MRLSKLKLAGGFAAALLAGAVPAIAQDNVLKIGSVFAQTGANASIGREQLQGAEYAVALLNKDGGVDIGGMTYQVELINIDDESKAERTVAAAEKLIGEEDVPVILTPPSSTTTLAIVPMANENERIAMSFVAAAPAVISDDAPYSFRSTLSSIMNVDPPIEYLVKEEGKKTFAYIGRNDDWGRAAAKAVEAKATELGAEMVASEFFEAGSTDFYGLLTKIRSRKPDVVVVAAFTEDGLSLLKQYRELQMTPTLLSVSVIWTSPPFLNAAGADMNGVYVSTGPTTTTSDALTAFKEQFMADTGQEALPFAITAFDAVNIVIEAMKRAGTIDPKATAEALRNVTYEGLLQAYAFNGENQSAVQININKVENGTVSVVGSLMTEN